MLEAEVQSLVPFIRGRGEVFHPLFLVHLTPLLFPLLVAGHIIGLNQEVQNNVHTVDGEQLAVTAGVAWRVILVGPSC